MPPRRPTKLRQPMDNPADERNPDKKADHLVKIGARFRNETVALMHDAARAAHGQLLDPSRNSLKKKAKVASKLRKKGVKYELRDVLRFTIVFPSQNYLRSVAQVYNFLASNPKLKTKAAWLKVSWRDRDIYKGINTSWVVYTNNVVKKQSGAHATKPKVETYTFELQFHTKESLDLKAIIHNAYDYVEYTCKAYPRDKSIRLAMEDGGLLATAKGIKDMERHVAKSVDSRSYRVSRLIPQRIRRMMGSGTQIQKESCAHVYQFMEQQAMRCPRPRGLTPSVAEMKLPELAAKFGGARRRRTAQASSKDITSRRRRSVHQLSNQK